MTALDENACIKKAKTKAKTKAKSYLPTKRNKYAALFYCIFEWNRLCLQSFSDNVSGKTMLSNITQRYLDVFPETRMPLSNF